MTPQQATQKATSLLTEQIYEGISTVARLGHTSGHWLFEPYGDWSDVELDTVCRDASKVFEDMSLKVKIGPRPDIGPGRIEVEIGGWEPTPAFTN